MNTDRALKFEEYVYYIMQMGVLHSLRSYAKWFHSYMYMKMPEYIF